MGRTQSTVPSEQDSAYEEGEIEHKEETFESRAPAKSLPVVKSKQKLEEEEGASCSCS